jgi:hypothetical protein
MGARAIIVNMSNPSGGGWRQNLQARRDEHDRRHSEPAPPSLLACAAVLLLEASAVVTAMVSLTNRAPDRTHLTDCGFVFGAAFAVFIIELLVSENARYWKNRGNDDEGAPPPPRRSSAVDTGLRDDVSAGSVSINDGSVRRGADLDHNGWISPGEAASARLSQVETAVAVGGATIVGGMAFALNHAIARRIPLVILVPVALAATIGVVVRAEHLTKTMTRDVKVELIRKEIHERVQREHPR